jgi:L-malate glycosyltransferase
MNSILINYELNRLEEIYSILFPKERVLIILQILNNQGVKEALEIDVNSARRILKKSRKNCKAIVTGPKNDKPICRFYHIQVASDEVHHPLSQEITLPTGYYANYLRLLKNYIRYRLPLIYEILKSIWVKWLDMKFDLESKKHKNNSINLENKIVTHKKILFLFYWLDVGGAEKFGVECCELARSMNKEIFVVSTNISRSFYFTQLKPICKLYDLKRQVPLSLRNKFILNLITSERINLIHNHHGFVFYDLLPEINSLDFPVVTIDSLHIDEKRRFGLGFPHISSNWTNFITWHHVISNHLKNELISKEIIPSKIIYGHLAKIYNTDPNFSIVNSISRKSISICFIGRMTEQKRPLLAFSMLAWSINFARKMGFEVRVDFVGEGLFLTDVIKATDKSGLKNYFTFHPSHANVHKILERNDILLIPSENEGITLTAFEAFNSGTLVVSTNVGAQKEFIPKELLLKPFPLSAFLNWHFIFKNLLLSERYAKESCQLFKVSAHNFLKTESALSALTKIYSFTLHPHLVKPLT